MSKYSSCGSCKFFGFLGLSWHCKLHKRAIRKLVGCFKHVDMNFKPRMKDES